MGTRDPRVDAYIAKQRDFAKPILAYLRETIHEACPDCVETLKWSAPSFEYHGILAGFAGFNEHIGFGFWKHDLVVGKGTREGMGFGRIMSMQELPPKKDLLALVRKAMQLNETGAKAPRMAKRARKEVPLPAALKAALAKNKKAKATYDDFSPSHRREYHEWIADAKADDTQKRRVAQAVEWMAEGKARNWKYM
jgi:hypothetical protein